MKTFFFKFLNNTLKPNAVLAKFDPSVNPICRNCLKTPFLVANRETNLHLFLECPETSELRELLLNNNVSNEPCYVYDIILGSRDFKYEIRLLSNLLYLLYLYFTFSNRGSKRRLSSYDFITYCKEMLENFCKISKKFEKTYMVLSASKPDWIFSLYHE